MARGTECPCSGRPALRNLSVTWSNRAVHPELGEGTDCKGHLRKERVSVRPIGGSASRPLAR